MRKKIYLDIDQSDLFSLKTFITNGKSTSRKASRKDITQYIKKTIRTAINRGQLKSEIKKASRDSRKKGIIAKRNIILTGPIQENIARIQTNSTDIVLMLSSTLMTRECDRIRYEVARILKPAGNVWVFFDSSVSFEISKKMTEYGLHEAVSIYWVSGDLTCSQIPCFVKKASPVVCYSLSPEKLVWRHEAVPEFLQNHSNIWADCPRMKKREIPQKILSRILTYSTKSGSTVVGIGGDFRGIPDVCNRIKRKYLLLCV